MSLVILPHQEKFTGKPFTNNGGGIPAGGTRHAGHSDWKVVINPPTKKMKLPSTGNIDDNKYDGPTAPFKPSNIVARIGYPTFTTLPTPNIFTNQNNINVVFPDRDNLPNRFSVLQNPQTPSNGGQNLPGSPSNNTPDLERSTSYSDSTSRSDGGPSVPMGAPQGYNYPPQYSPGTPPNYEHPATNFTNWIAPNYPDPSAQNSSSNSQGIMDRLRSGANMLNSLFSRSEGEAPEIQREMTQTNNSVVPNITQTEFSPIEVFPPNILSSGFTPRPNIFIPNSGGTFAAPSGLTSSDSSPSPQLTESTISQEPGMGSGFPEYPNVETTEPSPTNSSSIGSVSPRYPNSTILAPQIARIIRAARTTHPSTRISIRDISRARAAIQLVLGQLATSNDSAPHRQMLQLLDNIDKDLANSNNNDNMDSVGFAVAQAKLIAKEFMKVKNELRTSRNTRSRTRAADVITTTLGPSS